MNALEQFLLTTHVAPGQDLPVSEFHSHFAEWLKANHLPSWTDRETGSELQKHRELYRGNGNVNMISDIAWEAPYPHPVRQDIVDQWLPRVKFVDQDIGYALLTSDDIWLRMKPHELRNALGVCNVYQHETLAIKTAARANPECLSDLLSKLK
jgi:hypothetical protein